MKEKEWNRVNKKQLHLMVLSPIFEPWSPLTSSSKLLPSLLLSSRRTESRTGDLYSFKSPVIEYLAITK